MLSGGEAKEGENVFGQGSMTGIAISIFVKNPNAIKQGRILFHDVGDGLERKDKLEKVKRLRSICGIKSWTHINPDKYGDWLDQRDESYEAFLKAGDKKDKNGRLLFHNYSFGVATARDAWCVNPSLKQLSLNIGSTLAFYNRELERWNARQAQSDNTSTPAQIEEFIDTDPTRISWSKSLKDVFHRGKYLSIQDGEFELCTYRPFTKRWIFRSNDFNHSVYQTPQIFPNCELPNRVIAVTGKGDGPVSLV